MPESVWRFSKDEVRGQHGMVVSRDPRAARVGFDVLRDGGNAVDAAVTMAFALGVVEPASSGIGGGGMMVVHQAATGTTTVVDYAMDAPLAATPDAFELDAGLGATGNGWRKVKDEANVVGPRAASIPGTVRGLSEALARFGTLSLDAALEPAIRFAEEGVEVDFPHAFGTAMAMPLLSRFPASAAVFLPGGFPPRHGGEANDTLVQPDLARTLRRIASDGPDAFYRGEIAARIADHVQAHGGLIAEEDLARYRATFTEGGQTTSYRGCEIVGVPGACGAVTAQQGLNLLEGFALAALPPGSIERLHLEAEAFRLAFADRYRYVGDPKQTETPIRGLLAKEYAVARRSDISVERAAESVAPGAPYRFQAGSPMALAGSRGEAPLGGSTTHLSVVDEQGNVVALTQTLVNAFGCGVTVPETGIVLNNAMSWFDPEPGRVNSLAPGKRGLNNMAPFIVLRDGRPLLAVGAAGGRKIIHALAQVISNVVDHGMGVQAAISAPRIDCSGDGVVVSSRIPESVIGEMERRGHRVKRVEETIFGYPFATVLGVAIDPERGERIGGTDPYRPALAAGY